MNSTILVLITQTALSIDTWDKTKHLLNVFPLSLNALVKR